MSLLQKTLVVSKKHQMQQLAQQVSQQIFMADDVDEALDIIGNINPDLVVFDDLFSPGHVRDFLSTMNGPELPVVVVNPDLEGEEGVDELRQVGVYDYLQHDSDLDRLKKIAVELTQERLARAAGDEDHHFFIDDFSAAVSIVGRSEATTEELRMIKLVASSQCNPVLVIGETGTGKEVAARAVHHIRHPREPFVAVNCAALTANLLESELFGHVKGSFTGADREKTGLFELAGAGTIFLDEISEMPLDLQAKLLRVLQEKTFRKVGGTRDIECRATIVASSNRNLRADVQDKKFRQDLYYRLSICPIVLSPLRCSHRNEDILLLAEFFLKTSDICPHKQGKIRSLTKLAAQTLQKHHWPGNVRELKNVIDRALVLESTDKIGLSSIIIDPEETESRHDYPITADIKDFSLSRAERELIARALKETGWQKTQAASLLGITRATLYAKVKQYNIEKDGCVNQDSSSSQPLVTVAM